MGNLVLYISKHLIIGVERMKNCLGSISEIILGVNLDIPLNLALLLINSLNLHKKYKREQVFQSLEIAGYQLLNLS